jgi:hypothetical protein
MVWSIQAVMHDWNPPLSWASWYRESWIKTNKNNELQDRIAGFGQVLMIVGDSHAPELCLLVALYARRLLEPGSRTFLSHIHLCLSDMGLVVGNEPGGTAIQALGSSPALLSNNPELTAWMDAEMKHFPQGLMQAADFGLRLAAIRFGLLTGPPEPDVQQVLDETLWVLT